MNKLVRQIKSKLQKNRKLIPVIGGALIIVVVILAFTLGRTSGGESGSEDPNPDTRDLELRTVTTRLQTINTFAEFRVFTNKSVDINPVDEVYFEQLGEVDDELVYLLTIGNLGLEDNVVEVEFKDQVGNSQIEEFTVTVEEFSFPVGFSEIVGWDDSELIIDPNDFKVEISKQRRLPQDYIPYDLIDLNKQLGLYTLNNASLRSEPAYALRRMLQDLKEETGKSVTIASGYRSYYTQSTTYGNWVRELGEAEANKVSARPGHSEHQLGTTIDFVSDDTDWKITNKFGKTTAGKWLAKHAEEYGFIIPYDQDNTESGGYKEESWHYRYVGVEE